MQKLWVPEQSPVQKRTYQALCSSLSNFSAPSGVTRPAHDTCGGWAMAVSGARAAKVAAMASVLIFRQRIWQRAPYNPAKSCRARIEYASGAQHAKDARDAIFVPISGARRLGQRLSGDAGPCRRRPADPRCRERAVRLPDPQSRDRPDPRRQSGGGGFFRRGDGEPGDAARLLARRLQRLGRDRALGRGDRDRAAVPVLAGGPDLLRPAAAYSRRRRVGGGDDDRRAPGRGGHLGRRGLDLATGHAPASSLVRLSLAPGPAAVPGVRAPREAGCARAAAAAAGRRQLGTRVDLADRSGRAGAGAAKAGGEPWRRLLGG